MNGRSIIEYKNYIAELELDTEDDLIVGRVTNTADIISFHGKTVEEARKAFHDVLDTYLDTCREQNIEPSTPCSGKLSLRVDPKLHRSLKRHATLENVSLNQLILSLLAQSISRVEHRGRTGSR